MSIKPLQNSISFHAMGKIAYQTNKVVQNGLPFFKTTMKKGGIVQSEICRCKEHGKECVYGYKKQGNKILFFQSFLNMFTGEHAMSVRCKNISANDSGDVRYTIPWNLNNKKVPSFKDFFKM